MAKDDIVLITFPFTDLSGSKLRPAVILAETIEDITVSFITTQINSKENTDIFLTPNADNGLKKQSLLRVNKIDTLNKILAKGLMDKLSSNEINELNTNLKIVFQL
jgi:mRNA interferase MazF